MLEHEDTFEQDGREWRVEFIPDESHGAPWNEECRHGPVSDWTTRPKAPGELVLNEDRHSKRYYNFSEAVKLARRDGWCFLPEPVRVERHAGCRLPTYRCGDFSIASDDPSTAYSELYRMHRESFPTARAYHAAAAMANFERLREWCEDDWHYVGVVVTAKCECCDDFSGPSASLWGIESDADEYLTETAYELASEAASEAGDESVDEAIGCNGYEFTEEGAIA